MALRKYVKNNKKKASGIIIAVVLLLISVVVVANLSQTKADVFVKDETGALQPKSEINVLEVVAEYGQQVFGYTVKGYEPISEENIENYHGDINVEDFRDATGYVLNKEGGAGGYNYTVESKELDDTFDLNVLGDSMEDGEIKVNVCQANELTPEIINNSDLIFINTNNYNDNLYYYYKNIVDEAQVELGSKGANYNDIYTVKDLKKSAAIAMIANASGRKSKANLLSDKEFVLAEVSEYIEANLEDYIASIGNAQKDSLIGENEEDTLKKINALIVSTNNAQKQISVDTIKNLAGKDSFSDDEKSTLEKALTKGQFANYFAANNSDYFAAISGNKRGYSNYGAIQTMITTQNSNGVTAVIAILNGYKNQQLADVDIDLSDNTVVTELSNSFKKLAYVEIKEELITKYLEAFADKGFKFSQKTKVNVCYAEIKGLIDKVNENYRDYVRNIIANAVSDDDAYGELMAKSESYFKLADLEGYNRYNLPEYMTELRKLEDINSLKSPTEKEEETSEYPTIEETTTNESTTNESTTSEITTDESTISESTSIGETEAVIETEEISSIISETTVDTTEETTNGVTGEENVAYEYDIDKINEFIKTVNEKYKFTDTEKNYDISWLNAKEIYNYAILDEKGLMYDTSLLTNGVLGKIEEDGKNTNNIFKMLLVSRQLTEKYFVNNILPRIDEYGVFYDEGLDSLGEGKGNGVASWYKYSFYQQGSNDYSKYREPNVVGDTYSEAGVKGANQNYIYKHIYSFTGAQFFGGKLFVGEANTANDIPKGVITSGTGYNYASSSTQTDSSEFDKTDNWIFLDTGEAGYNWGDAYAYFWGDNGSTTVRMTSHDSSRRQFRVQVPAGMKNVIFMKNTSWQYQTKDISLGSNYDGNCYYLTSNSKWSKNSVKTNGRTIYFGNMTNSINNGVVNIVGAVNVTFKGYNITNASYNYNNTGWKALSLNQTIKVGEGAEPGSTVSLEVKYDTYSGNTGTKSYKYKLIQGSKVDITNCIQNSTVEYYGLMDLGVTAENVSNLRYSINDGSFQSISSGGYITFGEELKEGTQTKINVVFTDSDNKNVSVVFYFNKVETPDGSKYANNFLSKNTGTNSAPLGNDNSQSDEVKRIIASGTKGDVLRYIMGITLNELQNYPMHILEIQPAADASVISTYEYAVKLADYLLIDASEMTKNNYKDYFNVTSMSVKEFNTRNEDLTGKYDLIYFGTSAGYQVVDQYTDNGKIIYRTRYNDTTMNGLVYTGIGDVYGIQAMLRGTAAEDFSPMGSNIGGTTSQIEIHTREHNYWTKYFFDEFTGNENGSWNLNPSSLYVIKTSSTTTHLGGNDITIKKMNELLDYVKAGFPILMPDEIINCDTDNYIDYSDGDKSYSAAKKWRYVDKNSKMYNFIVTAKKLGYNVNTNEYDGLDANGQNIFLDKKGYSNLVNEKYAKIGRNPDNLSAEEKFTGGLSFATKRNIQVSFTLTDSPQEYIKDRNNNLISAGNTGTTISKSSTEYKNYKFVLKINSNVTIDWLDENYEYQIYIDKAGTGRFDEEYTVEIDPEYEYNDEKREVILEGKWPGNMDGFIPWKIVAYNKNNVANHFVYSGFSAFENLNKKDVNILWVKTESKNGITMNFTNMVKNNRNSVTDYNLNVFEVNYSDFVKKWNGVDDNTPITAGNSKLKIKNFKDGYVTGNVTGTIEDRNKNNGTLEASIQAALNDMAEQEFNMIVFGYCDSYTVSGTDSGMELDIKSIAALKNIDYFVESGHSLLFAHDNSSYLTTMNYYTSYNGYENTNGSNSGIISAGWRWGRYTTSYMRTMLGMDMYGATYSGLAFVEGNDKYDETMANARKYLSSSLEQRDFRGYTEATAFKYSTIGGNKLYSDSKNSSTAKGITDWQQTRHVMRVNQGQISEYPFIIGDEINTANTHSQYLTLNMEDKDVTVWYALDCYDSNDSIYYKFTKGDGANNFYIYSKGNITYTGAGHASGAKENEVKLFINTVVAAIKAGNFEPEVAFPNADKNTLGQNIAYAYDSDPGVTITFKPIDYDSSKKSNSFTDCKVYIDIDGDGVYTEGSDFLLNIPDDPTQKSAYLKDELNSSYINYTGNGLENRMSYTFMLTYEDINKIVAADPRITSIYDYPIVVQVTDNGTKNDTNKKTTVSNSIRVVAKSLFNLN